MGRIVDETGHGSRTVAGIPVSVRELGRRFEVHRIDTGEDLTEDGCFDTMPTDQEITLLAHRRPDWWMCRGRGSHFDVRTDTDLIVAHVRDCDLVDGAGNPIGGQQ